MSRTTGRFLGLVLFVTVGVPSLILSAPPTKPSTEAARFESYAKADGESFFALSLMPQAPLPAAENCNVVVLFDTSASQMGPYRAKGLEALRGLLATLGEKDRVQLLAVDTQAVPMTKSFVAPRGAEMTAALAQLDRRVPLGATDLEAALEGVLKSYQDAPAAQRAVIYIGDGQGIANLAGVDVAGLIDRLVQQRISIHSFAVGPAQNAAVLAALANQTGGVVALDGDKVLGKELGSQFSRAVHEPVIWAKERKLPATLAEVFPVKTPPLRSDRDTVLIGKGAVEGDFAVEVQGESAGKPIAMKWTVKAANSDDNNAYLAQLTESAQADGGYSLPTLGSEGLWESRRVLNRDAQSLAKLSQQAAVGGNVRQAQQLANEAVRRDPNNPNALVLKKSFDRAAMQPVSAQIGVPDGNVPPVPRDATAEPREGDLLQSVEQMQRVIQQQVMTETGVELNRARDRLASDPVGVLDEMKRLLDRVLRVPQLTGEQRADLRDRITVMLEQATQRRYAKEIADAERERNLAAARDRQRVLDNLDRNELRNQGLIERFNALVELGYHNADQVTNEYFRAARRDAADELRRVAANQYGREPIAVTTAREFGSFVLHHAEGMAVREAAERNYMDTLHLVDISHIPFPDSPPIVYPDAAFWRRISEGPGNRIEKYGSVDLASTNATEQRIQRELNNKTEFNFQDTPLLEAISYLKLKHNIEIQIDDAALRDAAIDPSATLVTKTLKEITLRSALKLLLSNFNLTYVIKDEVLMITSTDKADQELVTKVYPVADLVLPVQNLQPTSGLGGGFGGGGLGGGGGGGFGGGGGGLGGGGGGFGGGGGGLGGGLGGGGGGGFFNLPAQPARGILPRPASGGAMDIEDDSKSAPKKAAPQTASTSRREIAATSKAPANTAATTKAAPARTSTDALPRSPISEKPQAISVKADVDPDKFWNDYFAKLPVPDEKLAAEVARKRDAAVRETAKEFMNQRKFRQVTALVNGALRNGYAQPWMYEALALAMQADNQPKEEIERALMSAVDFASSPSDLMNIAVYMARAGLDARALKLLRQASALEPLRHEPYMHGLKVAQRLGNAAGIRWACLGVLSQAWPNDKKEIIETARFAADALVEKLRKDGQTPQADELRKQLDAALVRDCVVKITGNGNADVDLVVEEPSGLVCSYTNPRTAGGGVMQGDTYAKIKSIGGDAASEFSESYELPKGFSGQYKVLVRRIWGQVATGKVTVDVFTHYGTPQMVHVRQQIPVSERDALITFELVDGRRTEPLEQAQLATAAASQVAIARTVLAAQLAAVDSGSNGSNSNSGGSNAPVGPPTQVVVNQNGLPFFRNGAVGYMPQITTLNAGAMMSATAVISADRRYVRISPTPFFSNIGPVNTFNFATGTGGATGGGGAAGGGGGAATGGGGF